MKFYKSTLVIFSLLILCSCNDKSYSVKKTEVKADIVESYSLGRTHEVYVNLTNADIEIFAWNKDMIKFEVSKRLIGTSSREELSDELNKYYIKINPGDSKINISESYKGNDDNIIEKYTDIKIYTKNKLKLIDLKIKKGKVKFSDEINCSLNGEFDRVNLEMIRFDGNVNAKINLGNVSILNGYLSGDTNISINNGNIYIKSEFDVKGRHKIKTKTGNIELVIPDTENLSVNCKGNVDINEFKNSPTDPVVYAESHIGIIKVKKDQ